MENKSIIMNKYESIERCLKRVREEYAEDSSNLNNYLKSDAIVLNLQRACELVLDIAAYIVSNRKLGLPQSKKDLFEMLLKNNLIDEQTYKNMCGMIGFRNIAVHDYQEIDEKILVDVIENHLDDLTKFATDMLNLK